jgi:predicted DNA-binding transcriptional regulator AlpA
MTGSIEDEFGIKAQRVYRKSARETREILGLGPTAIDDAIADGTLPPPWPLTAHGKATGWLGEDLIKVQRKRQAAAKRRHAAKQQQAAAPTRKKKKR